MDTASPLRRRAALASLDANAMPHSNMDMKQASPAATAAKIVADAVLSAAKNSKKRASLPGQGPDSPVLKKTCLSPNASTTTTTSSSQKDTASASGAAVDDASSPAASSVFDNSEDASWSTTATEVDAPTRSRPSFTREQARERAEILRLRLGLASYKVRTGQISVPLADLQAKPLPRTIPSSSSTTSSPRREPQSSSSQDVVDDEDDVSVIPESSQESNADPVTSTPQKTATTTTTTNESDLPTSARKGGAVSGLLSLARGEV